MVWGYFSGIGFGPLVPMKGSLKASSYQVILDNFMLLTLWEEFGDGPSLFQHDCPPVHKASILVNGSFPVAHLFFILRFSSRVLM